MHFYAGIIKDLYNQNDCHTDTELKRRSWNVIRKNR